MITAKVTVSGDFVLADLDRRIFGNFVEQMGRQVYGGLYEPGHPTADAHGFRKDVIALVKELGVTMVRYPGGNYLSGYDWKDGVGPRDQRPRTLDLSRYITETHQIGTNEFIDWCKLAGVEPMLAINLESEGFNSARQYVEYCNHPASTKWSDLRAAHGYPDPHRVRLWCLGNEPDGWWQIAAHTAESYAALATETAKALKWIDPSVELTVAGSSGRQMAGYGDWERIALEASYDYVDYLAAHIYFRNPHATTGDYLANCELMDAYIKELAAMCDSVAGKKRSRKRMMISFDEWNIAARWEIEDKKAPRGTWPDVYPLLEESYTVEDALLIGGAMQVLLNNADRVRMACFAQLINCIAPIMTVNGGSAWRQTIFWPLALASRYGHGQVLRQVTASPSYPTKDWGEVPYLLSTVIHDPSAGRTVVFALNRHLSEPMELEVALKDLGTGRHVEATHQLWHRDLKAVNSAAKPDTVVPSVIEKVSLAGETVTAVLRPASWNVIVVGKMK